MNSKFTTQLIIVLLTVFAVTAHAAVTQTTTTKTVTTTRFSDTAPIYAGPVEEAELQELTLADFQRFGTKPVAAWDDFREYQKQGEDPANTEPRLYKMKVRAI